MVSFEADLPVSRFVQQHYPVLSAMLAATFDLPEKVLLRLLESATCTARLRSLKGALDRGLATHGLAMDIQCSCGEGNKAEATRLLFSVFKPDMKTTVKAALTIGVDETGVFIDLQGLLLHTGNDTRCRVDLEAIAAQLARTPKAQPFIAAALKALPVKPQTRAHTFKTAAQEALDAAIKVAPKMIAEGRTLLEVRYSAVIRMLQAAFKVKDVSMLIPTVDNVFIRGADREVHVLGDQQAFTLKATDPALPTGQISLELTCPKGQKVALVITPKGCGIDFGYLRLSTELGNTWDVTAFVHQLSKTPAFADSLLAMLDVFVRLVRETPEMRRLRYDVMRHLRTPAEAVAYG